tara:strand:+ start:520 stop:1209 length:690 start_codon:yes stop_codon:yes gene_type:complete
MAMRDSYEEFFGKLHINKDQFFEFGLNETIYADREKAQVFWNELKLRIRKNDPVYIRRFGRNRESNRLYEHFYNYGLGINNIKIDPSNNNKPTSVIREMTGYSKTKNSKYSLITNYQVSHIFGRTKNIYLFTAPWNIAYLPKIVDPFSGHEAKGEMAKEFQKLLKRNTYNRFKNLIEDYNQIISASNFQEKINKYIENISKENTFTEPEINRLTRSISREFSTIEFSTL